MTDSLRDQLLGLGFKPAPKPERKPERRPDPRRDAHKPIGKGAQAPKPGHGGKPRPPHGGAGKPRRSQEDFDLAKAYAIRAQREKDERIEAERVKQELQKAA